MVEHEVVVFLGPSLPAAEARRLVPTAQLLGPVELGAVTRAVCQGARWVLIVDGVFEQVPTVWHKEVLWALAQGVRVYGASSMGALRAAELEAFGMIGVGRVFELYASGEYEDDDEVAVVHAPSDEGYRGLSVAMVTIRQALADAVTDGALDARHRPALLEKMKRMHYPERSWGALAAIAPECGLSPGEADSLRRWLQGVRPDQKAADAVAALQRLQCDLSADDGQPAAPTFVFEETNLFTALLSLVRGRLDEEEFERRHGRKPADVATGPADADVALLHLLVEREARRIGLVPGESAEDPRPVSRIAESAELLRTRHRHELARHLDTLVVTSGPEGATEG